MRADRADELIDGKVLFWSLYHDQRCDSAILANEVLRTRELLRRQVEYTKEACDGLRDSLSDAQAERDILARTLERRIAVAPDSPADLIGQWRDDIVSLAAALGMERGVGLADWIHAQADRVAELETEVERLRGLVGRAWREGK